MVRYPYEKKGGSSFSRSMVLFSNFINDNDLNDLPLFNNREHEAMSRIDMFLYFSGVG